MAKSTPKTKYQKAAAKAWKTRRAQDPKSGQKAAARAIASRLDADPNALKNAAAKAARTRKRNLRKQAKATS